LKIDLGTTSEVVATTFCENKEEEVVAITIVDVVDSTLSIIEFDNELTGDIETLKRSFGSWSFFTIVTSDCRFNQQSRRNSNCLKRSL